MEVVEIREGDINIESEEEEDQTDHPEDCEGHLVFLRHLVVAGPAGLLVTLENNQLQPRGEKLGTVTTRLSGGVTWQSWHSTVSTHDKK